MGGVEEVGEVGEVGEEGEEGEEGDLELKYAERAELLERSVPQTAEGRHNGPITDDSSRLIPALARTPTRATRSLSANI